MQASVLVQGGSEKIYSWPSSPPPPANTAIITLFLSFFLSLFLLPVYQLKSAKQADEREGWVEPKSYERAIGRALFRL